MKKNQQMTKLIRGVRNAFNRLRALGDRMHGYLEVTAAMRAIMEALSSLGPMTVPQIAKLKGVSRQHVQLLADALCAAELVTVRENPMHRRSLLIDLTAKGKATFTKMTAREAPVIAELARGFSAQEMDCAIVVLERLSLRVGALLAEKSE